MTEFFTTVADRIPFEGLESDNPLAFRWYDRDRVVAGKTMEEQLRFAVSYWHSFSWDGSDVFGSGTLDRPWLGASSDELASAKVKMEVAFEFFEKLGVPFFCFHDADIAPAGATFRESAALFDAMVDEAEGHMDRTGMKLLWATANVFSDPRFQAGAATNPDPEVFAYSAAQVCNAMDAAKRLNAENYVIWGGREGYETLLNTDLRREFDQLGRFLTMVVEHKRNIGFEGLILIEPKPFEPTKHQYDFDVAAVQAFLDKYDLLGEVHVNIEVNHATLSGHDFAHEVAVAFAGDLFGSIDANSGDDRLGWDLDRFPVSVEAMTLGMYEILRGGGFTSGGTNFDAKLRRQSTDRDDLFRAHIGGMDTMAHSLLVAAAMLEDGALERPRAARYAGWEESLGRRILAGDESLSSLRDRAMTLADPEPVSGRQEHLENVVARYIDSVR